MRTCCSWSPSWPPRLGCAGRWRCASRPSWRPRRPSVGGGRSCCCRWTGAAGRRRIVGRLALTLVFAAALVASAWRFPARAALAGSPEQVAPFDLTLLASGGGECDGYYGIRPAALLKRPALAPLAKFLNKHIDTLTG